MTKRIVIKLACVELSVEGYDASEVEEAVQGAVEGVVSGVKATEQVEKFEEPDHDPFAGFIRKNLRDIQQGDLAVTTVDGAGGFSIPAGIVGEVKTVAPRGVSVKFPDIGMLAFLEEELGHLKIKTP